MKLIGFVNDKVIDSVMSMSESYMLFYHEDDMYENDVRAVNHTKWVEFFDMGSGNPISITGLMNFEIVNGKNQVVFSSDESISDDEMVFQYGIIKTQMEDDATFN